MNTQIKFEGDDYSGGYVNGLSMIGSETMNRFKVKYDSEEKTILETENGIILTCLHVGIDNLPVKQYITSIMNGSSEPFTLEMMSSFFISNIKADKVHRMTSFWSSEGRLKTESIYDLNIEKSWNGHGARVEKFGVVGSMPVRGYFPFVALENSETGHFTAATLYSPSSWQIELYVRREDSVTLSGGIADDDFGHWHKTVNPGETFTAPKALVTTGNSLLEVCNNILKAQIPNTSPIDNEMGIAFNEYCTTWGNPTIENMKKICDKLEGKGIQYLVMDSGWYLDKGQNWWDYTGKWEVNKSRFPNGLKELSDYARSKGMIPGIWFEPEVVAPGCELYHQKEYLLQKNGNIITVGGRRFLDMEKPCVREFLRNTVIKILKENNFGYIKIDYNDTVGIGCDGYESLGEGLRRRLLATQDFFKELRQAIPELVIENCSSGGHRLEPSMMELSSMASFSDAHEALCIPLIAANLLRLVKSQQNQIWAVMRKDDSDSRIFYSLCSTFMGRMGLSGDIYDLSDHQWELIDHGMAFYKKISNVIKDGITTLIDTDVISYNNPVGSQVVVKETDTQKLIIVHRFEGDAFTVPKHLFDNCSIVNEYGNISEDFSAKSWLLNKNGAD